ncbi:MAG TPA: Fic family protein [Thermomicrobiales bacterium]|nr:Fic family protein [Thermomicrobiales bacterium]
METKRLRAGQYVHQLTGYRAFQPAPLPPVPPITLDLPMQRALSEANIALGRLDGSIQTLPSADLFVYMYVRKEAVLSSQIEGTQSSLQDLLVAEAHMNADVPKDVDEVVNYVAAMNYGLERLATLPISVRLLRELHGILMRGGRGSNMTPGEIRTSQNWIGPAGAPLALATFVPPSPTDLTAALSNLEHFLHVEDDLPYLVKVGLAHAQFETIHPFLDGNGRIGRLLITFLLCQAEILAKPVLYLSWYLKRHRSEYYERLQAIRDDGAWEAWLMFFFRGIAESSIEASRTSQAILSLRDEHIRLIARNLGSSAAHGLIVLEHLYQQPIVSAESIQDICGISGATANRLAQKLAAIGILVEITGNTRNRRFQYDGYVRLFTD